MNPIIRTLAGYFAANQRVTRVRPDSLRDPKAIVVDLEGSREETHPIDTKNRDEFMELWKQASVWWDLQWEDIDG